MGLIVIYKIIAMDMEAVSVIKPFFFFSLFFFTFFNTLVAANNCSCTAGYVGTSCNGLTCASVNNCNGNGVCSGPSSCSCYTGYSGPSCNLFNCSLVGGCSGHGNCTGFFFLFFVFLRLKFFRT